MAKEAFNRKRSIFCGPLEKELRKRLVKRFVWSVALYGAETWTLRRSEEKRIEAFGMWIWRNVEGVGTADCEYTALDAIIDTTLSGKLSLPSKETLRGHSDSSFGGEGYIQYCVGVSLCDMYSNQELAEIHFMYGKADGNAALARRLYQERYPQRQCPDRKTFVRLHYRLCEYGKFNSPGLGRGRPRSTTPEVHEEILEAVNMTPSISTRRVALQVNVPHTTVWILLKE
ncbi:hypothetical protein ANN_13923 [Periplaneta americana]|uniref:DUF4817 domain-containing protein n=1 Tax=Periplaneta americana TaxID=6978 RepID=A0ABQ8SUW1_PERAM|nr:hypothetical protein ANN_13923 [Periplaneta americana]